MLRKHHQLQFNSFESISFARYFHCLISSIVIIQSSLELKRPRQQGNTARSCVRYWILLGWHRPQFVRISVTQENKKIEILDSGDENEMSILRKRNCHVHNESLKYELNRQVTSSKRLELMKCNFKFCVRARGQIIASRAHWHLCVFSL